MTMTNQVLTQVPTPPQGLSLARPSVRYGWHVSNERTFVDLLQEVLDRDFNGSKADFARAAGINVGQVQRYLGFPDRAPQIPRPGTLKKMSPLLGMSHHKLMDLVDAQESDTESALGDGAHPYAIQVDLLLGEGSTMPADERKSLEQVINTVLTPYRKYLGARKAV